MVRPSSTSSEVWVVASFLCLAFVFITSSCGGVGRTATIQSVITPDTRIRLDRHGCMGTCPVYSVDIWPDGSVSFEGKSFTKTTGPAHDRVNEAEVLRLVDEFKKLDFFNLQNSYGDCEDSPLEALTFAQNGTAKTVYRGEPCDGTPNQIEQEIKNLGREIDTVSNSNRWVRTVENRPRDE